MKEIRPRTVILIMLLTVILLFWLDIPMRAFFYGWKQESNPSVAIALKRYLIDYEDKSINVSGSSPLALYGERAYCYSTERIKERKLEKITLFSVNLSGEDRIDHYVGEFESDNRLAWYLYSKQGYTNECGVYYYDGSVFLRDNQKTVTYNLKTKAITESEPDDTPYPHTKYWVNVELGSDCTIGNRETGEQRVISLAKMAEKNLYAKKIFALSKEKTVNGWSRVGEAGYEFFGSVEVVEDQIYIIGVVNDFTGHSFAVLFEYDFETDAFSYFAHKATGGSVGLNTFVIPWLEKTV